MKNQQMIQAFLTNTSQEAFTDRIGSWRMNGRFEQLDATGLRHTSKARPKFVVVISYQILGCVPIRGGFSKLLCHPNIGRGSRDSDMDDLARLQFDEEEDEEWAKEEIGDLEEVTCPDL